MGDRWQRFAAEVSRFLAVGLLATIVALIIFNLLVHGFNTANFAPLNKEPELAYAIANAVGMLISYRGTKDWAFRDREARHADGGVLAFVIINLLTMTIPIACLWISRNGFGLDDPLSDNVSANVIGLLLANIARFFLFRTYVFQKKPLPFHLHLPHSELPADGDAGQDPATGELSDSRSPATSDPVPPPAP
jgi:putative flippase GtrA